MEQYAAELNKKTNKKILQLIGIELIYLITSIIVTIISGGTGLLRYGFFSAGINGISVSIIGIIQVVLLEFGVGVRHMGFDIIEFFFPLKAKLYIAAIILVYIISQIVFIASGVAYGGFLGIILSILIGAVTEIPVLIFAAIFYNDMFCLIELKNIAYVNVHAQKKFDSIYKEYDTERIIYNTIIEDILRMYERLNFKKPKLKTIDINDPKYDLPKINIEAIAIWTPFELDSMTENYYTHSKKYLSYSITRTSEMKDQITKMKGELDKKGDLYIEIKRIIEKANINELPQSIRELLENRAKEHIGLLGKINKKIKRVR